MWCEAPALAACTRVARRRSAACAARRTSFALPQFSQTMMRRPAPHQACSRLSTRPAASRSDLRPRLLAHPVPCALRAGTRSLERAALSPPLTLPTATCSHRHGAHMSSTASVLAAPTVAERVPVRPTPIPHQRAPAICPCGARQSGLPPPVMRLRSLRVRHSPTSVEVIDVDIFHMQPPPVEICPMEPPPMAICRVARPPAQVHAVEPFRSPAVVEICPVQPLYVETCHV